MQVKDVMKTPVHLIGPDAPLVAAARRMRDENVGSLPVGEAQSCSEFSPSGTSCALRRRGRELRQCRRARCHVGRAALLFRRPAGRSRVRRLPVIDQRQQLVGIVSLTDLSGRDWNTRPYRVVFYKELTTSASGQPRRVPLAIVHITDRHGRDDAEAAAIRKFERDRGGRRWRDVADGYKVVEPA